nr:E3 binding domain-containing protein [Actinomycetota bacterium]
MPTEIKMPQLGESVVEGTITKWLKQEGDSIDEDELLVEVSTDKVDSEVPSSASGTIQEIKVQEGETVKVGEVIAIIGEGGSSSGDDGEAEASDEDDSAASADDQPAAEGEEDEESSGNQPAAEGEEDEESSDDQPAAEGEEDEESSDDQPAAEGKEAEASGDDQPAAEGKEAEATGDDQPEGSKDEQQSAEDTSRDESDGEDRPAAGGDGSDTSKRGIISPLVRRLADEHGVDLEDIEGSGTGGRIRKQDVLKFVETSKGKTQAKPAASAEPAPDAGSK